jgi:hypothetical protein
MHVLLVKYCYDIVDVYGIAGVTHLMHDYYIQDTNIYLYLHNIIY